MKPNSWRYFIGALLVLVGGLTLLQSLNLITLQGNLWLFFFGALFAMGGLAFIFVLFSNRESWWAAIPGIILLSLGLMMILMSLFPGFEPYGGTFFLAGIGAAFWVVYFTNRTNWWAIIPGGTLLTLALISIPKLSDGLETGGIFFLGLAATFALLAFLPSRDQKLNWAWIPAAVLFIMGAVMALSAGGVAGYIWPVALICAGIFLLVRALLPKR